MSLATSLPPSSSSSSQDLEHEQTVEEVRPHKPYSPQPYNRSKTGCQTCRDRKVKCDELRPKCDHCQRLSLFCEWTPRLFFRDYTARIVGQYNKVDKSIPFVWHHESAPVKPSARNDGLASFGTLQSNEERERKAEFYDAGTFMMIATPESFERLPQYRRSLLGDRSLCPLSPQVRTSYRAAASTCSVDITSSCGPLRHQLDPTVHMVRTSGDIHAFLELEDEAWTQPRPQPPQDPSHGRSNTGGGGGTRFSVSAVVKGRENSRLADYGARIWRELSQATAEHLASYRWK